MPRKPSARVVYNRQTAGQLDLGIADGLLALCEKIVETARPPDAEPFGKGLVQHGGAVVYVNGQKVGGTANIGRAQVPQRAIVAFAGYSFPARFQELGTIKQPPRPFFTPAVEQVIPQAHEHIKPKVRARLGGI